jgi:hypothetical protein
MELASSSRADGRSWCRQHQHLPEFYYLPGAVGVDDFEAVNAVAFFIDINLAWLFDDVIEIFEGDVEDILFGIVGDAKKRQSFCLYLVAEPERDNFDLCFLGFEFLRYTVKIALPFPAVELANGHVRILLLQRLTAARSLGTPCCERTTPLRHQCSNRGRAPEGARRRCRKPLTRPVWLWPWPRGLL